MQHRSVRVVSLQTRMPWYSARVYSGVLVEGKDGQMKMSWRLLDLGDYAEGSIVSVLPTAQQRSYPFNSHSPAPAAAGASS